MDFLTKVQTRGIRHWWHDEKKLTGFCSLTGFTGTQDPEFSLLGINFVRDRSWIVRKCSNKYLFHLAEFKKNRNFAVPN